MTQEPVIGREDEQTLLHGVLNSPRAEVVAVYGRRRVGKTFLIRSVLNQKSTSFFQLTGTLRGTLREQLQNFADAWHRAFGESVPVPPDWHSAFRYARSSLESRFRRSRTPVVLFFDELPWLCGKNHRFLPALEHFWNDWGETQSQLKLVVCGSAASWMVQRIVRARGGLHNRVTHRMQLRTFSIQEVLDYLRSKRIRYTLHDAVKLYLMLGGVPYYLRLLERGRSVDRNIEALCFGRDAPLRTELTDLYESLFSSADRYLALVALLAKHHRGLTRQQLTQQLGKASGGGLTQMLHNLEASDFIAKTESFHGAAKHTRIRLVDEFSRFSLQFLKRRSSQGFNMIARGPAFHSWAGLAFEAFCLRHADLLRQRLGIEGISSRVAQSWSQGTKTKPGFEIDLLFDREDNVVSICEMKFSATPFTIEKRYAQVVRERIDAFASTTGTKKAVQHVWVTLAGVSKNAYSHELVDREIQFNAFLKP